MKVYWRYFHTRYNSYFATCCSFYSSNDIKISENSCLYYQGNNPQESHLHIRRKVLKSHEVVTYPTHRIQSLYLYDCIARISFLSTVNNIPRIICHSDKNRLWNVVSSPCICLKISLMLISFRLHRNFSYSIKGLRSFYSDCACCISTKISSGL